MLRRKKSGVVYPREGIYSKGMNHLLEFIIILLVTGLSSATHAGDLRVDPDSFAGFPAISKDGKQVAAMILHTSYEGPSSSELVFVSVKSGAQLEKIEFPPNEPSTKASREALVLKAQERLKAGGFESIPLVQWSLDPKNEQQGTKARAFTFKRNVFEFKESGKLISRHVLKPWKRVGECCDIENPKAVCFVEPNPVGLWVDSVKKVSVLSYGYFRIRDGCESDTLFSVTKL